MSHWKQLLTTAALVVAGHAHAAFTVTPGTLVGIDLFTSALIEYSFGGTVNETLAVATTNPVGVEVVNGEVYVLNLSGEIGRVDLVTGAVTVLFNVPAFGVEGLGGRNGHLLVLNFVTGLVDEYNLGGALLGSFVVGEGGTGVDGRDNGFSVGFFTTGSVAHYDAAGALLSGFDTGFGPGTISALAHDNQSGHTWVADGFGSGDVRRFDANGNLVSNFASGTRLLDGLDVIGVPEPAALGLVGIALAGLAVAMRSRRRG